MQFPTVLSSEQSAGASKEKTSTKTIDGVVKENSKATKQIIAN